VESGLDIPNANTIIINNAHWFGLSDLHQLRGRVGRSNKKAYCYLISPPLFGLPDDSRKRLRIIEQFADLGSGFQISMRDLDIRGAGNLLGAEQSGFISEIGFDMYHKILDEAIRELKQTQYKTLFAEQIAEKQEYVRDVQIDTDLEMLIPDEYITNINERMSIYTRLDNVVNEVAPPTLIDTPFLVSGFFLVFKNVVKFVALISVIGLVTFKYEKLVTGLFVVKL
jgi:transcription-repair coupling factor (superfamily II helicase)